MQKCYLALHLTWWAQVKGTVLTKIKLGKNDCVSERRLYFCLSKGEQLNMHYNIWYICFNASLLNWLWFKSLKRPTLPFRQFTRCHSKSSPKCTVGNSIEWWRSNVTLATLSLKVTDDFRYGFYIISIKLFDILFQTVPFELRLINKHSSDDWRNRSDETDNRNKNTCGWTCGTLCNN